MIALVVVIHILVCVTLIGVVLLQQGKGADVGAVFGGSSQTVFGASGAGNLLTKVTGVCAVIFFTTSLILAYTSTRHATSSVFEGVKVPLKNLPPGNLGAPVAPPALGGNAPSVAAAPAAGASGATGNASSPAASTAASAVASPQASNAAAASVVATPAVKASTSVAASAAASVAPSPMASVAPSVAPTPAPTAAASKATKTKGKKVRRKTSAASAP